MEIDRSMFLRHKAIALLSLIQAILVVRLVSSETGESMQLYLSNQWYVLSVFSTIVLQNGLHEVECFRVSFRCQNANLRLYPVSGLKRLFLLFVF